MKTTKLEIVGVILMILAYLTGFVVAQNTGDTEIEGNIQENAIELTVPPALTLNGNPGQTMSEDIDAKVTSNNFPWGIGVKSDSSDGKMREFDGTNYVTNPSRSLAIPMHVVHGSNDVTLSDQDHDLMSNEVAVGTDMPYNVKLIQETETTDASLPSGHVYRIVVTLTGRIQI